MSNTYQNMYVLLVKSIGKIRRVLGIMNKILTARPLLIVAAVLSFAVAMFVGGAVQASSIDSKPYVDTIVFDKTSLVNGESASVSVTFSEKDGHKFKSGDSFTMPLPKELRGFKNTLKLGDYGTAVVSGDTVTVSFNDKVDKKKNVKGGFKFTVSATEELGEGQSKVLDTTFGTIAQSTEVTLNGRSGDQGTGEEREAPFAYKGGNANVDNPAQIDWYIVANANNAKLGADVVIKDTLKGGQTMKANSLLLNYTPIAELVAQGHVTYEETDTSFKLVVKQAYASGKGLNITYSSMTTEAGKKMKEYQNDFSVDFQLDVEKPDNLKGAGAAQNMSGEGFAEGDEEPEVKEPKIHEPLIPTEEEVEEETTDPIDPIVPEVIEPKIVEPKTDNKPKVTEPEVKEPKINKPLIPTEEEVEEETTDPIDPIVPEVIEPKIVEPETDNKPKVTEPEVKEPEIHEPLIPTEEEVEEETTDPIDPIVPEVIEPKIVEPETGNKPKVSIPEVVEPKVDEKPKVEVSEKKTPTTKKPVTPKKVVSNKKNQPKAKELPNTASSENEFVAVAGLVLMILTGLSVLVRLAVRRRASK